MRVGNDAALRMKRLSVDLVGSVGLLLDLGLVAPAFVEGAELESYSATFKDKDGWTVEATCVPPKDDAVRSTVCLKNDDVRYNGMSRE